MFSRNEREPAAPTPAQRMPPAPADAAVLGAPRGAVRRDLRRRHHAGADRRLRSHRARARSAKSTRSSSRSHEPRRRLFARRPVAAGRDSASSRRQLGSHRRGVSADRANGYPIAGNLAHWPHDVRHATATGSSSRSMRAKPAASSRIRCARRCSCCPAVAGCSSARTSSNVSSSRRGCARRCSGAPARACCSRRSSD